MIFILHFSFLPLTANSETFEEWKLNFSNYALKQGVSPETLTLVIEDLKFLPKVIEYDRYQPEFYEDTSTYIGKRTNNKKVTIGLKTYKSNTYAHEVEIKGESKVIYSPDKPLSCGARVWIETESEVVTH